MSQKPSTPALTRHLFVSKSVRDTILDAHPGARGNAFYEHLLTHLYYPASRDKENDLPRVGAKFIAQISGHAKAQRQKKTFSATRCLDQFISDVEVDFDYSYTWGEKELHVTLFEPLDVVLDAIRWDNPVEAQELVDLYTGTPERSRDKKKQRKSDHDAARKTRSFCFESVQREIFDYMNGLKSNSFTTAINNNFANALAKANDMYDQGSLSKTQFWIAFTTLHRIATQPQPFYQCSKWKSLTEGDASKRSIRVVASGSSMLTLKKSVRRVLTQDWVELDLASSQFAINAYLWDIPELKDFLVSGNHLWTELFAWLGLDYEKMKQDTPDDFAEVKDALKKATYSAFYGMKVHNLKVRLTKALKELEIKGAEVLRFPLFTSILEAREREMKQIEANGGAKDIFGNELPLIKGDANETTYQDARSILAQRAQAVEMYLLEPAIDLAKQDTGFQIVLWQHDGFSVNVRDKDRITSKVAAIQEAVNKRATELGVITELEAENLEEVIARRN